MIINIPQIYSNSCVDQHPKLFNQRSRVCGYYPLGKQEVKQ